ncbi:MAG TPA: CpsB/CapC family capsule biosynthesis tyrosine phosphatase [Bryobacteraceae bacterium]|jgi:protein-tyrosine phosphatase|nr:CpsB/CapC family capsule biosynthesis tyrosine phosphatase [Bryobacteraceae bacterium]
MTDTHSHIVWGVDDGPPTMEISLTMLEVAASSGTTDIVATPHANPRYFFQRDVVLERIDALNQAAGGRPRVHFGCEFHLSFDNVDHLMENLRQYTINGKQYLLVECPDYHIGQHTESVLRRMIDSGIVPIIAHPERNPVLREKLTRAEEWVELGCLLQITAMSITGRFGSSARSASHRLFERGLVHVVASDAHDPENRSPRLSDARQAIVDRHGEDIAAIVLDENPRAIVEGAPILGGRQVSWTPTKKWFHFWKK